MNKWMLAGLCCLFALAARADFQTAQYNLSYCYVSRVAQGFNGKHPDPEVGYAFELSNEPMCMAATRQYNQECLRMGFDNNFCFHMILETAKGALNHAP